MYVLAIYILQTRSHLFQVPVTCSGSLFFQITDGYKACFEISDVQKNIERTGTSAMRSVLGSFTYDQVRVPLL